MDDLYGPDGRIGTPTPRLDSFNGKPGWGIKETSEELTACERAAATLGHVEAEQTITEFYRRRETNTLVPLQGWARTHKGVPIFVPIERILSIEIVALLVGVTVSTAYKLSRMGKLAGKMPPALGGKANGRVRIIRDLFLDDFVNEILRDQEAAS